MLLLVHNKRNRADVLLFLLMLQDVTEEEISRTETVHLTLNILLHEDTN